MANKDFGKGTEEWMMFVEFWNLCKKHWIPENADEYWNELLSDMNEFFEKYKDIIPGGLAQKLAVAFCDAKDEEHRAKKS